MTPQVFAATDQVLALHRTDPGRSTLGIAVGELDSCTASAVAAAVGDVLVQGREVTVDLRAWRPAVLGPPTVAGLRGLPERGAVTAGALQAA